MKHRTGWSPEQDDALDGAAEDSASDDERSTIEVLRLLAADARSYAETEMERQKLRARVLGAAGRDAALLVLAALFLLGGVLVALLVGGMFALAPIVGVGLATLIVIGSAALVVLLLLVAARARVRRAVNMAFAKDDEA